MREWIIRCAGGMWDAMLRARCWAGAAAVAWARGRCGLWRCKPDHRPRREEDGDVDAGWLGKL